MKVFDLGCDTGHAFEGWFGSENDYKAQREGGLLECPLCGSRQVERRLSAPRLNLKTSARRDMTAPSAPGSEPASTPSEVAEPVNEGGAGRTRPVSPEAAATMALMQKAWLQAMRQVVAQTEDVGERFAEEARRIHYGESPDRGIRGTASSDERESLMEEGIEVVPLVLPKGLGGPLQ